MMKLQHIAFLSGILIISSAVLIVGVVRYIKSNKCGQNIDQERLVNHLQRVKNTYYDLYRSKMIYNPSHRTEDIINQYMPYDPSPASLKSRTDAARQLRLELDDLNINTTRLLPREKKALAQLKHYTDFTFGYPHGENYYAGDWMMGPNYFCVNEICSIGNDLKNTFNEENGFKPCTIEHVDKLMDILKKHKSVLEQYERNMMTGVQAGMVRSNKDCKASRNAFAIYFANVAHHGKIGVLHEDFSTPLITHSYYSNLTVHMQQTLQTKYKKPIEEKMAEILYDYVGAPVEKFLNFLEKNYTRYCVPENVVSGLAHLPLKHVWLDNKPTRTKTNPFLPTGEKLSGITSYGMILPFYTTTTSYTADDIKNIGEKQLAYLYEKAVKIAIKLTGKRVQSKAVDTFKKYINSNEHYFNTTLIPDHENGETGGRRCRDMKSAQRNCPVRFEALKRWFAFAEMALAIIEPKTIDMFYLTGKKATTPNCPLKMRANFNPSVGSQSFKHSDRFCTRPAYYNLPFFLKRPGPRYNAFSVAGHEGRPGHHTQVQGFIEHFEKSGRGDVIDWLNGNNYYTAFVEGWALYGENPLLAKETDLYADDPLQEYGMLKWQLWRALRLVVDTGLHTRNMTMQNALDMFEKFCWDTTDKAYKDVIRYMSLPGQATAYMIGQLEIWRMRNETEAKLKKANIEFDKKEFHYQILSQGSAPIDFLREHIDTYIECKINPKSRSDCEEVMHPELSQRRKSELFGTKKRWSYMLKNSRHRQTQWE